MATKKPRSKTQAKKGKAKKSARQPKRAAPAKPEQSSPWPIISLVVLLALIIGAIFLLRPHPYPVHASRAQVLEAFRAHNVSEVIIVDLTNDFLSGNYTLDELAKRYPGYGDDIEAVNEEIAESEHEVVATVNDETITRSDLTLQENMLPPQYRQLLSEEQILQQMIDEKLLMQEAEKQNITVSDDEIEQAYNDLLEKGNLTEEELEANLATFGMTPKDLREMIVRQLTVQKLFDEAIPPATVSAEEARAFYNANKELFITPEQVTVKHILISTKSRSEDEAKALAEHVLSLYENGTDFCQLVTQYSDDPGSKTKCGEYTFGRGYMVPEFENASFTMKDGETRIVKTSFGYHLILKVESMPAETAPFDEVQEQIIAQLEKQQQAAQYKEFISELRSKATIVNKLEGEEQSVKHPASEETTADAKSGVDETIADAERDETEETTAAEETSATAKETDEERGEAASEATTTAPQETSDTVTVTVETPAAPDDLASCLEGKDVTLYTIDWATASLDEAKKYGDLVKVIDCSQEACEGISAYPTWKINGELHTGSLSEAELAQLAGC